MRRNLVCLVLFASALGGTCYADSPPAAPSSGATGAATTSTAATTTTTAVKTGYDPNAQICKWSEETGTLLGRHKTCHTRAEWEQISRDSQDQLNDTVKRADEMAPPGH